MQYMSMNCWNVKNFLIKNVAEVCDAIFFPFNAYQGNLFAVKSGLFHMAVWVVGENIVFFILLIFQQDVRVVAIAGVLGSCDVWLYW